ncbi:hypothetical protein SVIO_089010 [Streptomyces violaceusniger]|uniref:ABC transmembrane type-1 domain-containing protein n=1 Tax=Streptomyces violaceusniger TaxID=68280 RepID=A0A4D4LIH2_STRVO|nr:hypothetical protein SVIO_089010 [Streptomyces violaceusniger]
MLADWTYAFQDWPTYLSAAWLSLKLSLAAFALACALGLLGALARRSRHALVRAPAAVYVEVIRNTPVLLQMFVAYFALPSAGLRLSPVQAGIAALGVNVGAYLTEIFRAGIQAVPRGQREASRVLALTPSGPICTWYSRRPCATSIRPWSTSSSRSSWARPCCPPSPCPNSPAPPW